MIGWSGIEPNWTDSFSYLSLEGDSDPIGSERVFRLQEMMHVTKPILPILTPQHNKRQPWYAYVWDPILTWNRRGLAEVDWEQADSGHAELFQTPSKTHAVMGPWYPMTVQHHWSEFQLYIQFWRFTYKENLLTLISQTRVKSILRWWSFFINRGHDI